MFERFTDRARRAVVLAQEQSRLLGHDFVGTEHLLLGLVAEGEGVAAKALASLGISLAPVRTQIEEIVGRRTESPAGHIPFTPRSKKVLELSLREALTLGHNYIGTEHILLGIVREGKGLAVQILVSLGADLGRVRETVLAVLQGDPTGIAELRHDYDTAGLERADLASDPITQFIRWFDDASNAGLEEPHAMTLATTTPDRRPDARVVLLRGVDERGFVWFTNRNSRKGRELEVTPFATLVFAWIPLHRQIRVDGEVTVIDDAESDAYFSSRPRAAQIGAWASQQSEVLDDRATLDAAVASIEERFGEDPIPRPPHWGGYRLAHETLEVWQGRANRLHDRFRYRQELGGWLIDRLWP